MKTAVSLFLLAPTASAFVMKQPVRHQRTINKAKPSFDAVEGAIAEAQKICADDPMSSECKVMWDIVEELEAAESHAVQVDAPKTMSHASEYASLLTSFDFLMEQTREQLKQMKALTAKLAELETSDPSVTKLGDLSEELKQALAQAKAADDVYGPDSPEAVAAWDAVVAREMGGLDEKIANASAKYKESAVQGHHHEYNVVVDPESLREALDAFGRIEHLGRLVAIEKDRMDTME